MEAREDLRIIKSKRDLCNALRELVLVIPFGKITVGDICEKAMINRMTFYRHYKDKYELFNDVIQNIQRTIVDRVENCMPLKGSDNEELGFIFKLLDEVIAECVAQKAFFEAVKSDEIVLTMISTTIEKAVGDLLEYIDGQQPFRYRLDMLSSAITGATTFLIRHWLMLKPEETALAFSESIKGFFRDLFASKILFEKE